MQYPKGDANVLPIMHNARAKRLASSLLFNAQSSPPIEALVKHHETPNCRAKEQQTSHGWRQNSHPNLHQKDNKEKQCQSKMLALTLTRKNGSKLTIFGSKRRKHSRIK